jgi:proline-specific peptidase
VYTVPDALPVTEGTIPFSGGETWYRVIGDGEKEGALPVLLLHGGPGGAHDYLEPMGELAQTGRRAIFYDQLGCGRSPYPSDPSKWTVELFVEEVDAVRDALGLARLHVLGQSWGGMLGMEYALTQPEGLQSLIICDSPSSMQLWVKEANRLRALLPPEVNETLLRHEQAGTTDSEEYEAASQVFYDRHVCRVVPNPDYVKRSLEQMPNEVYMTMNGPSEFHCIGTLRTWDVTPRLGEIEVPTLVISGQYDEATPLIARTVHQAIPGSEWVLFEDSSHMPHVEEPERFLQVVGDWLERHDPGT